MGLQGQCSLYLKKPTETWKSDFTSVISGFHPQHRQQCARTGHIELSWAEPVHWLVRGQEQSVWCTGGLTSNRGEDVDMSLTILCPSTRVPSPPVSAYVLNQRAVWPSDKRYTGRKSGLTEMVSVMSGQYVRQGERERETTCLNPPYCVAVWMWLIAGKKGDKVLPNTIVI